MSALGRMARRPHVSRDYALEDVIDCAAAQCPANRAGKCIMPSAIKISAAMQCQTGQDLMAMHPHSPQKPVEGD